MITEPLWMLIARGELMRKVREIVGPLHSARILLYHLATKLRAKTDEKPWCASFVCWCLEQAGVRSPRSARAADFTLWGVECEFRAGCIVVFDKVDPDAGGSGHVAFGVREDGDDVWVLGGNQQNRVSIARRPKSRIVAKRWPVVV